MLYVDPMLPRMTQAQLCVLIGQAAAVLAQRGSHEELRVALFAALEAYPARQPRPAAQSLPPGASLPEIVSWVASQHGLPVAALRARHRGADVVRARWHAFADAHAAGFSLPRIGRWFGVHHTTVLHGVRRHRGEA
jgi:hypothetical protein